MYNICSKITILQLDHYRAWSWHALITNNKVACSDCLWGVVGPCNSFIVKLHVSTSLTVVNL